MTPTDLEIDELDRLTPIQREIFALLAQGFPTSKLIGRRMNMNPRRVDKHIAAVCVRLGVSDRRSALAKLIELERKALENHPPGERFPLFDLDRSGLSLDVLKSGRRSHVVPMWSRKSFKQTANAPLFRWNSAGFMPSTTWSQVSEALSTLANGSVRRDLIQAWVASTARNARWLPPEMTLALVLHAAIVIVGERKAYCIRAGP